MSRCWGCCQENCGYSRCSCSCHETERGQAKVEEVKSRPPVSMDLSPKKALMGLDSVVTLVDVCKCGAIGAHYCVGARTGTAVSRVKAWRNEELRQMKRVSVATGQCPDHKRYQAKRKPRSSCESCWRIWIALNPG